MPRPRPWRSARVTRESKMGEIAGASLVAYDFTGAGRLHITRLYGVACFGTMETNKDAVP